MATHRHRYSAIGRIGRVIVAISYAKDGKHTRGEIEAAVRPLLAREFVKIGVKDDNFEVLIRKWVRDWSKRDLCVSLAGAKRRLKRAQDDMLMIEMELAHRYPNRVVVKKNFGGG